MSEKVAQDLASRLADAALRLSSWAKQCQGGTGERRDVLQQLGDAVQFVQSTVDDLQGLGSGKAAASPSPLWGERPRRPWGDMDDPLEGMRGHSRAFTIPELLSFVSVSHKTGILRVHTDEENFLVQLEGGMVVYARSDHLEQGEHLAEILVANGIVGADVIAGFERQGPLLPEALGKYLCTGGHAREEDVQRALVQQVHFIFRRLSHSRDAYFRFYEGARVKTDPEVNLNINKLLIESARCSDEETHRDNEASRNGLVPIDHDEYRSCLEAETPVDALVQAEEEVDAFGFRAAIEAALESDSFDLPLLDAAANELLVLCWDEQVNAETLEEHIGRDQGLCAHILRVANSAAFAPVVPVASVQLAIARLGMDRIREIALAMTVRKKAFEVPGWEHEVRTLWRRSAVTSGFAKALSRRIGATPQRGGLLGLLQDVGKPVVLNTLCELEAEHGVELGDASAQELMQEFHGTVGSLLARRWALPAWLEAVLRHHHDYGEVAEHREDVLVAHAADRLATWAEDRDAGAIESLSAHEAFAELGLRPEQVRHVLEETDAILAYAEIYA